MCCISISLTFFCCSNPGHPFAAGLSLAKLAAVTVDEDGKETFVTGGALDRVQKASCSCHAKYYLLLLYFRNLWFLL